MYELSKIRDFLDTKNVFVYDTKDGAFYIGKNIGNTLSPENEYHTFNKNHTLVKKADLKTKYALCNDCNMIGPDDTIAMALGEKYEFFEKGWEKEWNGEDPEDISTSKY